MQTCGGRESPWKAKMKKSWDKKRRREAEEKGKQGRDNHPGASDCDQLSDPHLASTRLTRLPVQVLSVSLTFPSVTLTPSVLPLLVFHCTQRPSDVTLMSMICSLARAGVATFALLFPDAVGCEGTLCLQVSAAALIGSLPLVCREAHFHLVIS